VSARICPQCGTRYEGEVRFCSLDGATLVAEGPAASLVGSVIADRYLVLEKLGEGGMGEVYLAEHVRMKRKVAVKVMRPWLGSDPAAIGRFHREAENASQITHPNVAQVYDFGETAQGIVYLAMEYVPGESLRRLLEREGALAPVRVADIVSQTADALAAAHSLGILHRDLKPDNVMIGRSRVGTDLVKLLDFGIARVMGRETQAFTSTGMVIGTPEWMSPEQLSGDVLDQRSDLYALGLMAFRMLTGAQAFPGGSSQEVLVAKMTRPPLRLDETRPDVPWPQALQAVLDRALASDPAARYADALVLAADFYAAVLQLPLGPDGEAYLAALARRAPTPPQGVGALQTITPVQGTVALDSRGDQAESSATGATQPFVPPTGLPSDDGLPGVAVQATAGSSSAVAEHVAALGKPRRKMGALLWGGAVLGLGVVALALARQSQPRNIPASGMAEGASAESASAASAHVERPSGPSLEPAQLSLDSAAARSRSSVFAVLGSGGRGAGFLADSSGVVVTLRSLLGSDSSASVFLDGGRKVYASVIPLASQAGLAALLVPIQHCPRRCLPLPIGDSALLGDSVIAVGAPLLVGPRPQPRGVIIQGASGLAVGLRLPERNFGAPLLTSYGKVVGLAAAAKGGLVQLAGTQELAALLAAARREIAVRGLRPRETLPPSWPSRPIGAEALAEGARRKASELDPYRIAAGPFEVLVMTPQIMSWRRALVDSVRRRSDPFVLSRGIWCGGDVTCDPIESWSGWREYLAERRAVVVLEVAPAAARPPFLRSSDLVDFRQGDFSNLEVLRDGVVVTPIESTTIPAVANPDAYGPRRPVFRSGIYVLRPADLIPGAATSLQLVITDVRRPREPYRVTVPAGLLQAVARDLKGFER
jgi:serine/threonine protein kinase